MKSTTELLDAVKRQHGLTSDYQLAKLLAMQTARISHYRAGRRFLSDETALQVAKLLDVAPGYVLAIVAAERAQTEEIRKAWQRAAKALAGAAVGVLLGCGLAYSPGVSDGLHNAVFSAQVADGLWIIRTDFHTMPLILLAALGLLLLALGQQARNNKP